MGVDRELGRRAVAGGRALATGPCSGSGRRSASPATTRKPAIATHLRRRRTRGDSGIRITRFTVTRGTHVGDGEYPSSCDVRRKAARRRCPRRLLRRRIVGVAAEVRLSRRRARRRHRARHGHEQAARHRLPGKCRTLFVRGTHLSLHAVAAPGWRFTGFKSTFCNGAHATCVFDMVSSHDCVGGACPTGVFGVRARFVRDS